MGIDVEVKVTGWAIQNLLIFPSVWRSAPVPDPPRVMGTCVMETFDRIGQETQIRCEMTHWKPFRVMETFETPLERCHAHWKLMAHLKLSRIHSFEQSC